MFAIGKKYIANSTAAVRRNGILPGWHGYVTFVDPSSLSLLILSPAGDELKLRVPRTLFGINFREADPFDSTGNGAYRHSRHFEAPFK